MTGEAQSAAHEGAKTLITNVAQMAGNDPGEIVVLVRGSIYEDGDTMFSWEWFWRPADRPVGSGGAVAKDAPEKGPGER